LESEEKKNDQECFVCWYGEGVEVREGESEWSWQRILSIPKINKSHSGEYVCLVGDKYESGMNNKSIRLYVQGEISLYFKYWR
jgi:hypothetical protein